MRKRFRTILIVSGLFNIIFSLPLMIPGISESYLNLLNDLNYKLNLSGRAFISPTDPVSLFLINAAGLCLAVIGLMVIYASINIMERTGLIWINIAGRLSFAIILTYYLLFKNLLQIVALFGIVDLIFCGIFFYFLLKTRITKFN